MGLRIKHFNIMGVHRKIRFLDVGWGVRGLSLKNKYVGGIALKGGGLDSLEIWEGLGEKLDDSFWILDFAHKHKLFPWVCKVVE